MITRDLVRQIAVFRQGLHQRPATPDKPTLKHIIRQIGLLQLDSISVTARSHYLVMLSRAGLYDRDDLDSLLTEKYLFEQWAHAACLVPMEDYAYFVPKVQERYENDQRSLKFMGDDPQGLITHVLDEIRENGPLASRHFESKREGEGGWWNWKPTKVALEYLFLTGQLMTSHRENFHRFYDLPERVLDGIEYTPGMTLEDYERQMVISGLRNQGVGTVADIADYYRLKRQTTQKALKALVKSGEVIELEVHGWDKPAFIHKDDLHLLDQTYNPQVTTFLSPFDNLIWYRDRTEALFDFFYRVEMYTPAKKRVYGYYVLPVLHNGQLIGRIDPKIDRKAKLFIIRAFHLHAETITDEMVAGVVGAIREFMTFHHCTDFTLEMSTSDELKTAIMAQL